MVLSGLRSCRVSRSRAFLLTFGHEARQTLGICGAQVVEIYVELCWPTGLILGAHIQDVMTTTCEEATHSRREKVCRRKLFEMRGYEKETQRHRTGGLLPKTNIQHGEDWGMWRLSLIP